MGTEEGDISVAAQASFSESNEAPELTALPESPSNNDSGHESNTSTPELPLTPQEERSMTPDKTQARPSGSSEGIYRVKLVLPNKESFDIQINGNEMIQEIHQILLERESTCHRTCFRLQYEGLPLDLFTEIRNIPNFHSGDVLQVVEMPYTIREARLHIRHLRELLRSLDVTDGVNGTDGNSLSYLPTMMQLTDPKRLRQEAEKKKSAAYNPPEYLLPGSKELRLMTAYFDVPKDQVVALNNLSLSAFNPPPGPRKMKGDILYLVIETVEGNKFHITCSTKGFYVNSSKDGKFDPRQSNYHNETYHSLVDLLSTLSSGFKKAYTFILRKRNDKHLFERLPTPYPVHSWMVPYYNHHTEDYIRAEDATQPHKLGIEDAVPVLGQLRDWNEELQTTRELPRNTEAEAIIRERAMFKVHSDFVAAAVKGAMAVVDGNACPINPADDPRTHMFLWNNIFFSLGFDVKDHYKDVGGDPAAHAAANNDLLAIRAYHNLDTSKLYTLGMVIVDYKGYRVTAQSIIPGILEKDQEQSVVYGSIDFGKTVVGSHEYEELLQKPAEQLRILPHEVYSGKEDGHKVKLYSSFETKGIIGNDGRHYVLDLLRTFPPDVNFLEDTEVTEICKQNGFPRKFPHKLVSLRHELIELFLEKRHATFMHAAWTMIHRLRAENISDKEEREKILKILSTAALMDEEKKNEVNNVDQIVTKVKKAIKGDIENTELKVLKEATKLDSITDEGAEITRDVAMALLSPEMSQEMLSDAAHAVGSISEDVFDVRFNPDCYCTTVKHAETENLDEQRKLVASAAEFLLVYQIPQFIHDCLAHLVLPIDGQGLISALHARGINVRYVGRLVNSLKDIPQLDYVFTIAMTELLCRSARHVYRKYIRSAQVENLGVAAAHFLNCFVGYHAAQALPSPTTEKPENGTTDNNAPVGQSQRKSKNRRKNRNISTLPESKQPEEWTTMTIRSLWKDLADDSDSHYGYRIEADHCDAFIEISGAQRISIVRRFCMMNGVQLILKDYNLDSKTKLPFTEDDIHNMYPVIKHMNPHAKDAQNLFLSGQTKVHQGILRMGYDLISESLGLMNNIYGAVHPDMVQCMRLLGRLAYVFSDTAEALNQQHKATLISERCNGLDHAQTIMEYIHMAHFMFANLAIAASLKLLYRARFLLLTVYGENHPIMGQIDANIGVILYTVQDYDSCLKFLNNSLRLTLAYNNQICLKTALIYNILAHTYSCRGDFRMAIQMQKETSSIYAKAFGEDNEKTKEASIYLRYLTQEAVSYQKRVNEASRTGSNVGASCLGQVLPYQVQQPTMQTIIETLNMINGIVFIHVKPNNSSSSPPPSSSGEKLVNEEKSSQTTNGEIEFNGEEKPKLQDEGLD